MRNRSRLPRTAVVAARTLWIEAVLLTATGLGPMAPKDVLAARLSEGPVVGDASAALDSLAPDARGVFLAEVARITEHDDTPVDGDRYVLVHLTCARASGITKPSLYFHRSSGGLRSSDFMDDTASLRPRSPQPSQRYVRPDEFLVGRRYWFATGSHSDARYPQGILGYWPVESTTVASLFERAVAQDAYRWHPASWGSGFVSGWSDDSARGSSRVRVWLWKRPLWEKRLSGLLTHWLFEASYARRATELGGNRNEMRPPGLEDTAMFLCTEVRARLDSVNVYGVRPGTWRIQQLHDMWSGRLVASRVRVDKAGVGDVERVYQAYDPKGRLIWERIQDLMLTGGTAVGAGREDWLRRVERWLDGRTGRQTKIEVKRFAAQPTGSDWLPVDSERGLAAGPLRNSNGVKTDGQR